jgi:hypothetical protein
MPERVALVFDKSSGGVVYQGAALKTPMVWEIGTDDLEDHIGMRHFRGQMFAFRPKGMVLSLVLGPGESHTVFNAGSAAMVATLIDGIFKLRVPAESDPSKGPVTLNVIDESTGQYWLGDNYTREVASWSASADKDKLYNTSFLPSEAIANMWKVAGANLPATIKVESNGVCSGCYAHPASEPPGAPMPGGGSAPPPAGDADAGAGPVAGPAGQDASSTAPTGGSTGTGGGGSPGTGGSTGATIPPSGSTNGSGTGGAGGNAPAPAVHPRGTVAGGCSMGGRNIPLPAGMLLIVAAIVSVRRRRRA